MSELSLFTKSSLGSKIKGKGIWVLLFLLILIPSLTNFSFLTLTNLQGFLQAVTVLMIVSIGESLVLLVAGVDLSVGAIVALGSIVLTMSLSGGMNLFFAVVLTIVVAALCGFVNGVIVTYLKLPSFIVTFGMMAVAQGIALILSGGNRVGLPPDSNLSSLIYGNFLNAPYSFWISLLLLVGGVFFMKYFRSTRYLYSVGSNLNAARLSGISIQRSTILAFTLSSLFAGIASIFYTARIMSGDPIGGGNLNLEAIASCVIGGISLFGGRGNLIGAALGAIIYTLISNILNLYGVNPDIAELVGGIILAIAAYVNVNQSLARG